MLLAIDAGNIRMWQVAWSQRREMFERQRIRREFSRIVSRLQGSELFSVDPDIYDFFVANEPAYAKVMRDNNWTPFGTCVFMISHVCDFLHNQGRLPGLRRKSLRTYESLRDLYGFAVLSTGKRPDAEQAFFTPQGEMPFKLESE